MCRPGRLTALIAARLRRPPTHKRDSRQKALGQNFLFDKQVLRRFAGAAGDMEGAEPPAPSHSAPTT